MSSLVSAFDQLAEIAQGIADTLGINRQHVLTALSAVPVLVFLHRLARKPRVTENWRKNYDFIVGKTPFNLT